VVEHHCDIGDFAHLAPGVLLGGGVKVGAAAMLGLGAVVLPGLSIGSEAVVGAGAVVTRNVPPGAVVAGNPAVPLRPMPSQ
jgi:acetyltransferase-like isoleucine patch superfamily enzyme